MVSTTAHNLLPFHDRGKLSQALNAMDDKQRAITRQALEDESLTGGEIARALNIAGFPVTRSQVNHHRRRARAERLVEEAHGEAS